MAQANLTSAEKNVWIRCAFVIIGLLLLTLPCLAEPVRLALVVGNSAYEGDVALKNPTNDAKDFAEALKMVGWHVTLVTDTDRRTFNRSIQNFRDALAQYDGASALFYYAGHGVQIDGINYLIPVKTSFETVDDIKTDAVSVQAVATSFEEAKVGISLMILDACRDNPFVKKMTRSVGSTRGLSVVQSGGGAKGSAIMFSTSPGDVALDGTGRNGVFTAALLKYVNSDMKLEDLFKKVTAEVRLVSGGSQKPWINASMTSDFYFLPDEVRRARAEESAKQVETAKKAEIEKVSAEAAKAATASEAAKTELARAEADAAKKAIAEMQAIASKLQTDADARSAAEAARPKGKARFESFQQGTIWFGRNLVGQVGPNAPLVTDSLPTGIQEFRFESPNAISEIKTLVVTDMAFGTLIFGLNPLEDGKSSQIPLMMRSATGNLNVSSMESGQIFLDGAPAGFVTGGADVEFSSVSAGARNVEIRYTDGRTAMKLVRIEEGKTATAIFERVYKIGDRGPAGGIVFFDKGSMSDGWRYLEAADKDIGERVTWHNGKWNNIKNTEREVGTGKSNTDMLVEAQGLGSYAAYLCKNLDLSGFQDWFLPSVSELELLYANLKLRGLGNFSPTFYWSSSQFNFGYGWRFNFEDGTPFYVNKADRYRVRPIRAF
jgi:uncharacterized caspase-like protein